MASGSEAVLVRGGSPILSNNLHMAGAPLQGPLPATHLTTSASCMLGAGLGLESLMSLLFTGHWARPVLGPTSCWALPKAMQPRSGEVGAEK